MAYARMRNPIAHDGYAPSTIVFGPPESPTFRLDALTLTTALGAINRGEFVDLVVCSALSGLP